MKAITCYGRVNTNGIIQEHYASTSGDARRRAQQLRKLGIMAAVTPLGNQVTRVGTVKMTMVTFMADEYPHVDVVRI